MCLRGHRTVQLWLTLIWPTQRAGMLTVIGVIRLSSTLTAISAGGGGQCITSGKNSYSSCFLIV